MEHLCRFGPGASATISMEIETVDLEVFSLKVGIILKGLTLSGSWLSGVSLFLKPGSVLQFMF